MDVSDVMREGGVDHLKRLHNTVGSHPARARLTDQLEVGLMATPMSLYEEHEYSYNRTL